MRLQEFRRTHWGLERILFSNRPPQEPIRHRVFAARETEFERAEITVLDAPRNVLVSGQFGIGKTIFVQELIYGLVHLPEPEVIAVYECLDDRNSDLLTTILRGLAHALRHEDEEAQRINELLTGAEITEQRGNKSTFSGEAGLAPFGKAGGARESTSSEAVTRKSVTNAAYHVRGIVERAVARSPERRLVVAVDDLDKRDPATVLASLVEARSTLHLDCSFILTGHPLGMLRDLYSTAGGVFDRQLNLGPLAPDDLRTIMIRYLDAGRVKGSQYTGTVHPFTEETAQAVIRRSLGIPRLLNKICLHLLEKAAELRKSVLDVPAMRECWESVRHDLRREMQREVAELLQILRERQGDLDPALAPDEVFDRLGIDSTQELLALLNAAIYNDMVVGTESGGETRFLPQPLLEEPPVGDNPPPAA